MKTRSGFIAMFLVMTVEPFALAQHGGVHLTDAEIGRHENNPTTIDFQRAPLVQATNKQREAFAKCMATTEVAGRTGRSMGDNTYWNGLHGPYNLSAVYRYKDQFESALTEMEAAHRQFLTTLSQDQVTKLKTHLSRLEHLHALLIVQMSRLEKDLKAVRPDSYRTSIEVYDIGTTIDNWHYEHGQIAKKIGIVKK